MKKRVFIIHGWGGKPDQHWLPGVKSELEKEGFVVEMPQMPDTDVPVIEKWVGHLAKVVGEPDEHTYLVGHSIGAQTIMRYLAGLEGKKVGGVIMVAGWLKLENLESEEEEKIAEPWLREEIVFEKVLRTTSNILVLNSSNDDYGAVEDNRELFEAELDAEVRIMENKGHFTEEDGVTELPEVVEQILEWESDK